MKIRSRSVSETKELGRKFAANLIPGDIICLFGQLGAGKTVFTKGLAAGLGIKGNDVISPSFVLMRAHQGRSFPLYHFDLYRLEGAKHIAALGYEEYFYGQGVSVVEWADRLKKLLPADYLRVEIKFSKDDKARDFNLSAEGRRSKKLLEAIIANTRH